MLARLSVSRRILLGFGLVIALLAGIGGVAYVATLQVSTVFDGFRKSADQSLYSSDLSAQVLKKQTALAAFQRNPSHEAADALRADIATLRAATDRAAVIFADAPKIAEDLAALTPKMEAFRESFDRVAALEAEKLTERTTIGDLTDAIRVAINGLVFTANISGDASAARDVARGKEVFLDARYAASLFTTDPTAARFDAAQSTLREARSVFETLAARASGGLQTSAQDVVASLDSWGETFVRYRAATDGQNAELSERMEPTAAALVAGFDAATAAVASRQGDLGQIGADQVQSTQLALVTGVAAALAIGVALAVWIGQTISTALRTMADSMRRIAESDLDVTIQGEAHRHELGAMARALRVFRDNALEMRRMTEERAEAEARAEADRRAMMAELQEAFGLTVDAAVAGDFGRRVSAEFPDAELTALAEGVNRLLDTVESGLDEVSGVMGAVADGRLDARVSGTREGAFAALAESVNRTVDHLSGLVSELQTVSARIEEGSTDIAHSAVDLSARAESQASSLEETAATMEEMSATIKANADNAASATALADNASQNADHGGQVVSETVAAMAQIEASSGRIADIIGVIDGIAFQTNLLALNAAVEAARAGDAGKGFAVVAQEVRTLAQRCAEAAQDVKSVIGESASHVAEGARLANDAGDALAKITQSIQAVSHSVADISAASREQASGVEEMTIALNQMDEMTQRNSAMAEGSASAARRLNSEAGALQSLVGHFGAGGATGPVAEPQTEAA